MRTHLGVWLCILAGCAVPPAVDSPSASTETALNTGAAVPQAPSLPIRIGVEFLPPTSTDGLLKSLRRGLSTRPLLDAPPRIGVTAEADRPLNLPRAAAPAVKQPVEAELPWTFDKYEIRAIKDPFERVGVRFVRELIGDNLRRARREFGPMIHNTRHHDLSYPSLPNYLDERRKQDEELFFAEHGRHFIRRPMRNALKSFTIFQDLEVAIEDFKSEHLPITSTDERGRPARAGWGRVSMRLRVTDHEDPLEFTYRRSGWRFGTSQERIKARYTTELVEDFTLSLTTRFEYESSDFSVRANLTYVFDETTRAHLVAGESLGFFSNSEVFTLMESPLQGDAGLLFYVEHLF